MLKDEIRKEMRMRKRQLGDRQLAELSLGIMGKLLSHPRIRKARTVLMYHSLPDEADTHKAIDTLVEMGKRVLLPAVVADGKMEVRPYEGSRQMKRGAFGIEEPSGQQFALTEEIDVAVIPGVAFDSANNRLGRGKGYYDRFLPSIPQAYKIGVCFEFQKLNHVPTDTNDIKMDEII